MIQIWIERGRTPRGGTRQVAHASPATSAACSTVAEE